MQRTCERTQSAPREGSLSTSPVPHRRLTPSFERPENNTAELRARNSFLALSSVRSFRLSDRLAEARARRLSWPSRRHAILGSATWHRGLAARHLGEESGDRRAGAVIAWISTERVREGISHHASTIGDFALRHTAASHVPLVCDYDACSRASSTSGQREPYACPIPSRFKWTTSRGAAG